MGRIDNSVIHHNQFGPWGGQYQRSGVIGGADGIVDQVQCSGVIGTAITSEVHDLPIAGHILFLDDDTAQHYRVAVRLISIAAIVHEIQFPVGRPVNIAILHPGDMGPAFEVVAGKTIRNLAATDEGAGSAQV